MKLVRAVWRRAISFFRKCIVLLFNPKKLKIGINSIIQRNVKFEIFDKGSIYIGNNIGIRENCLFSVAENGKIDIGDNCFFNRGCIVASHLNIFIGDGTKFGPGVFVYDHDYDFKNEDPTLRSKHITSPVVIGKNCWIGAGTVILRGTKIGDNSVVGAGAVIKGEYKENSLVIQKRDTISEL
jgi:Acetyltransferase (isoleucine patch superfamily)